MNEWSACAPRKWLRSFRMCRTLSPPAIDSGDLLIVAWGSTHGPITAALKTMRAKGHRIGHVHLRHLNPLPKNLGEVLGRYDRILVPEMNMGQLVMVLRAKFLVDAQGYNKIQGKPFKQSEIEQKIEEMLELMRGRL